MDFIKSINGQALPVQPSSATVTEEDIHDEDSGRAQNALAHIAVIATKVHIPLTFSGISPAVCDAILNIIKANRYKTCEYYDVNTSSYITKTFYLGSRQVPLKQFYDNGEAVDLSFELIER